ncbi:MAG TPA: PEGA domain-containing protein [Vicinamibacterales bacterium]|nr:PEGA domain-containing protein [Vicinamibacterales bacterium]
MSYPGITVPGELRISVKPNTAAVYVDGYLAGRVDDFDGAFQRLRIEPGQHEIVVYLAGYRSLREHVYVGAGNSQRIGGDLIPLGPGEPEEPKPTPLYPPSDRRGAITESPAQENTPPPDDVSGSPPNSTTRPAIDPTTAAPATTTATLSISVKPGNAEIVVDGVSLKSAASDEWRLIQVAAGRHLIEIRKPGYLDFSTETTVQSGETVPLAVTLTRD